MRRGVESINTLHANRGRPSALDLRSHFDEQGGEIGNFGFERAIFENGFAFGQHGGREDIFRPRDRDLRKAEHSAVKARRSRFDVAMIHRNRRA